MRKGHTCGKVIKRESPEQTKKREGMECAISKPSQIFCPICAVPPGPPVVEGPDSTAVALYRGIIFRGSQKKGGVELLPTETICRWFNFEN